MNYTLYFLQVIESVTFELALAMNDKTTQVGSRFPRNDHQWCSYINKNKLLKYKNKGLKNTEL